MFKTFLYSITSLFAYISSFNAVIAMDESYPGEVNMYICLAALFFSVIGAFSWTELYFEAKK